MALRKRTCAAELAASARPRSILPWLSTPTTSHVGAWPRRAEELGHAAGAWGGASHGGNACGCGCGCGCGGSGQG